MANLSNPAMISYEEVQKHKTDGDCWCVIHGHVYNLTSFLKEHPGGSAVIMKQAGRNATAAFAQVHSQDFISLLPEDLCLGPIDPETLPKTIAIESRNMTNVPPLSSILNLFEFEKVAEQVLSKEAWAYYSSAADDEITLKRNHDAFHRYSLKPKVLVNVKHVDTSTFMFGVKVTMPIYITATALGKLGHPEGEVVLTRAAGTRGIIQMMPTLASCSIDEMTSARIDGQTQWFQLYVNEDRKLTEKLIKNAERLGAKALCITVDAPALGRREKDMRVKFINDAPSEQNLHNLDRNEGAARAISSFISPSLCWADIPWFKKITNMHIVLKGIQSGADAVRAARAGVQGIIISNHGGRQLDTALSGIEMLQEVMDHLNTRGLSRKMEVYMDGGVRRGTDVYKALALGAKGVGLGRPFLYAMSAYGQQGVEKAIDNLKEEFEMVMRLMGTPSFDSITRDCIYVPIKAHL